MAVGLAVLGVVLALSANRDAPFFQRLRQEGLANLFAPSGLIVGAFTIALASRMGVRMRPNLYPRPAVARSGECVPVVADLRAKLRSLSSCSDPPLLACGLEIGQASAPVAPNLWWLSRCKRGHPHVQPWLLR